MILCIDIGGTATKMALMREGVILQRYETPTAFDDYETPVLDTVCGGTKAFLEQAGVSVEGISVSATGQIDTALGKVIGTCGNIRNYEGAEIKKTLENLFHVPCTVLNDANAAALGECYAGAGQGRRCVLMITLGTGIGGGIVSEGHVFGGAKGIAGEIGHFTLKAGGETCTCGRQGCFERYASTSALVRKARELTGERDINGRIIFERAGMGDLSMLALLDDWMNDIADGASGLVHIFNPDLVLFGGGVSAQTELLLNPLREKIHRRLMREFSSCLEIEAATLGNDAGLYGAFKFFMDEKEKNRDSTQGKEPQ